MSSGEEPQIPDATPWDATGLRLKKLKTRQQVNAAEAENIQAATIKYLAARPSARIAPFTFKWVYRRHKEMFRRRDFIIAPSRFILFEMETAAGRECSPTSG